MTNTSEEVIFLAQRYLDENAENRGRGTEFTIDELDVIRGYVLAKFSDDSLVLRAFSRIDREFSKGHRCSVCGMTDAQSKEIGYNCTGEC